MKYIHTCYRVLDLDRSLDFYTNKLGLELARKTPIGEEAINAFLAVPGDPEPRLELTLNYDREEPYALWVAAPVSSSLRTRTATV